MAEGAVGFGGGVRRGYGGILDDVYSVTMRKIYKLGRCKANRPGMRRELWDFLRPWPNGSRPPR
jgi:hypothetical protein